MSHIRAADLVAPECTNGEVTFKVGNIQEEIEEYRCAPAPQPRVEFGQILFTLAVDGGEYDAVCVDAGRTSDLTLVRRAITALQAVEVGLVDMYGDAPQRGRCVEVGDWGRCKLDEGHGSACRFPTGPTGAEEVR